MNRRTLTRLLIALIAGISVTFGQSILVWILFPAFAVSQGTWLILSFVCFNCGAAGLLLFM